MLPSPVVPLTALVTLIACGCASSTRVESEPVEDAPVPVTPLEAQYFNEEVFVRTRAGQLARFRLIAAPPGSEVTRSPGQVLWWHTDAGVWDLVHSADGRSLLAVMSTGEELFVDAIAGKALPAPYRPSVSEVLGVVSSEGSGVTVVGRGALEHFDHGVHRQIRLQPELERRGFPTVGYASDGTIYVGFNAGEWGGGLARIEPESGTVEVLGDDDQGSGCGKPLDADCDPVVAIIPDPEQEGCVLAAVGLIHFRPSGRLLRVCGVDVEVAWTSAEPGDERSEAAVFGVAALGPTVVLSTSEGIVQLGRDPLSLPAASIAFEYHNGLWLSGDLGGLLFVGTEANRTHSVSAVTSLLVPTRRPVAGPAPIELQPL